ncbi:MAG: hypothetical protein N3I86_09495 [Verrucomicrobiae bacterium]|nr:hypothetical protein [Verrucomicrobiae bacterium]MDW8309893.1 hypothetical protein [Verrucomicrobiales bacterium]
MIRDVLRSRWFAATVHVAAWLLLLFILLHAGGRHPLYREARYDPTAVSSLVPVARLEGLLAAPNVAGTNSTSAPAARSVFDTTYFIPQTAPPPPPPTTRKVELTYLGFFRTGEQTPRALIRFGDALASVPVGAPVVTNWHIAAVTTTSLTLTNSGAQTNLCALNAKLVLEIPLQ